MIFLILAARLLLPVSTKETITFTNVYFPFYRRIIPKNDGYYYEKNGSYKIFTMPGDTSFCNVTIMLDRSSPSRLLTIDDNRGLKSSKSSSWNSYFRRSLYIWDNLIKLYYCESQLCFVRNFEYNEEVGLINKSSDSLQEFTSLLHLWPLENFQKNRSIGLIGVDISSNFKVIIISPELKPRRFQIQCETYSSARFATYISPKKGEREGILIIAFDDETNPICVFKINFNAIQNDSLIVQSQIYKSEEPVLSLTSLEADQPIVWRSVVFSTPVEVSQINLIAGKQASIRSRSIESCPGSIDFKSYGIHYAKGRDKAYRYNFIICDWFACIPCIIYGVKVGCDWCFPGPGKDAACRLSQSSSEDCTIASDCTMMIEPKHKQLTSKYMKLSIPFESEVAFPNETRINTESRVSCGDIGWKSLNLIECSLEVRRPPNDRTIPLNLTINLTEHHRSVILIPKPPGVQIRDPIITKLRPPYTFVGHNSTITLEGRNFYAHYALEIMIGPTKCVLNCSQSNECKCLLILPPKVQTVTITFRINNQPLYDHSEHFEIGNQPEITLISPNQTFREAQLEFAISGQNLEFLFKLQFQLNLTRSGEKSISLTPKHGCWGKKDNNTRWICNTPSLESSEYPQDEPFNVPMIFYSHEFLINQMEAIQTPLILTYLSTPILQSCDYVTAEKRLHLNISNLKSHYAIEIELASEILKITIPCSRPILVSQDLVTCYPQSEPLARPDWIGSVRIGKWTGTISPVTFDGVEIILGSWAPLLIIVSMLIALILMLSIRRCRMARAKHTVRIHKRKPRPRRHGHWESFSARAMQLIKGTRERFLKTFGSPSRDKEASTTDESEIESSPDRSQVEPEKSVPLKPAKTLAVSKAKTAASKVKQTQMAKASIPPPRMESETDLESGEVEKMDSEELGVGLQKSEFKEGETTISIKPSDIDPISLKSKETTTTSKGRWQAKKTKSSVPLSLNKKVKSVERTQSNLSTLKSKVITNIPRSSKNSPKPLVESKQVKATIPKKAELLPGAKLEAIQGIRSGKVDQPSGNKILSSKTKLREVSKGLESRNKSQSRVTDIPVGSKKPAISGKQATGLKGKIGVSVLTGRQTKLSRTKVTGLEVGEINLNPEAKPIGKVSPPRSPKVTVKTRPGGKKSLAKAVSTERKISSSKVSKTNSNKKFQGSSKVAGKK